MTRPIWKGHITFGLVTIPVIVHSAEKQFDLHFRLLDSRNHARVRYERVNEETGEEVSWQDVVKGFEYEEGKYVVLKDEDFEKVAIEVNNSVEIESFVDGKQIDYVYFDKPYYLVPDKKGEKGYVLLREVLQRTGKVGIAKVVIRTRQYLAALLPQSNVLVLELLRFHQEIRGTAELEVPEGSVNSYKISQKELLLAQQLVESMTTKWEPKRYHDEYRDALMKWIEKKSKNARSRTSSQSATRDKKSGTGKVIDMMGLLKKSVQQTHSSTGAKKRKSAHTRKSRKAS
ncbi:MAG: Ku protein [Nitrospira sp.]|nr:Ku protein [Nitrospira sp.]HBP89629.1 Ku protein [Nitrospiraceae bacterium]HNP27807.1 Ku protein [Nitrospirales bacterium]